MSLSTQLIPEVFTWEESIPQVNIMIDQTQKLVAVLSEKWQEKILSQDERIGELLELIRDEVKQRSEKIGYNYYDLTFCDMDFQSRLGISDKLFEEVLTKRVLEWKLLEYYNELLNLGDPEIMRQRLLIDYWIDDLVYEALRYGEFIQDRIIKSMLKEEFERRFKNSEWSDLIGIKFIWFSNIDLSQLWREKLKKIFSNFRQIKRLSLSWTNLWNSSIEELLVIFRYFSWVRWIWMTSNNLWNLWEEELEVISLNICWIKYLNLMDNKLENLSMEELNTFFKNFKLVKYIDVRNNKFSKEQRGFLIDLLPNTKIIFK